MKKNDLMSLRQKNIAELKKLVTSRKSEFNKSAAFLKASGEKNMKKAKNLRHEISQILTLIREKEILEEISNENQTSEKVVEEKEERGLKIGKGSGNKKEAKPDKDSG